MGLSSAADIADSIQNFGFKDSAKGAFEFLGAKSEFQRDVSLGKQTSYDEDDDDENDQRKKRSPCKPKITNAPDSVRRRRQVPAIDTENIVPGQSANPEKDPNMLKRLMDAIVDASNRMVKWVEETSKKLAKNGQQ